VKSTSELDELREVTSRGWGCFATASEGNLGLTWRRRRIGVASAQTVRLMLRELRLRRVRGSARAGYRCGRTSYVVAP